MDLSKEELEGVINLFNHEAMIRVHRIDMKTGFDKHNMSDMLHVLNSQPNREKRRIIQRFKDR